MLMWQSIYDQCCIYVNKFYKIPKCRVSPVNKIDDKNVFAGRLVMSRELIHRIAVSIIHERKQRETGA